jgi:hypothetical protein
MLLSILNQFCTCAIDDKMITINNLFYSYKKFVTEGGTKNAQKHLLCFYTYIRDVAPVLRICILLMSDFERVHLQRQKVKKEASNRKTRSLTPEVIWLLART